MPSTLCEVRYLAPTRATVARARALATDHSRVKPLVTARDVQRTATVFETRGARDPQITRNYKLDRLIAAGGMGHVLAARRRRDQRRVAIKILQPPAPGDPRYREYMLHEVFALTVGANPALVELLEFGETSSGTPYIVLDWIDGPNLGSILARESPLATWRAVHLFTRLLDAVEALHQRGVVHGDLKPENMLLVRPPDGEETMVLVDLGTARVGGTHVSLPHEVHGTPGYIAPESARGDGLTPQCDIYAAGVVLFELLTGSPPFDGDTLEEVVEQQTRTPRPRPSDHRANGFRGLDDVVAAALAPSPVERYRSVAELRAAFHAAIDATSIHELSGIPLLSTTATEHPTSPYRRAVAR